MKYLVPLALLATGCVSQVDKPAAAANLDNVKALVGENSKYTAADTTIPASLKATRAARNEGAVKVAEGLAR